MKNLIPKIVTSILDFRIMLIHYDVIAETENEAIYFIKEFEPFAIRDTFKIEEIKKIKKMPNELKGVYHTIGYCFYDREQNEDAH
jgi:hypothetical protein